MTTTIAAPGLYSGPALQGSAVTHTALAGIMLGAAGDWLLWNHELTGPGLTLWLLLAILAALLLNHQAQTRWRLTLAAWSGVAFLATLIMLLRASPVLNVLMLLIMVAALTMTMLQASGKRLADIQVDEYLKAGLLALPRIAMNTFLLLGRLDLPQHGLGTRARGIVRGLLFAVPLLLIFVLLFSSADATFSRYASRLGDMLSMSLPRHMLIIAVLSWLSIGFLAASHPQPANAAVARPRRWELGTEETAIVLGSLALLFMLFVALQSSYLFGGRETIEASSGLTLAEYARRGFFELVLVASLALVVLLVLTGRSARHLFKPLALVLIACVLVILVSAAQRLALYTDEFGLTLDRVIAAAFMLWLAGNQIAFAATVLRGRDTGYLAGMLLSGMAMVMLLALANPAALVARTNIDKSIQEASELDVYYLTALGADAVPEILLRFNELSISSQCQVAQQLLARWQVSEQNTDWRDWNASMARAWEQLALQQDALRQAANARCL